jgi:hypothetical protein
VKIIEQSHDDNTSAYLGVGETLVIIKQKYYWPGIRKDVRYYVAESVFYSELTSVLQKKQRMAKMEFVAII